MGVLFCGSSHLGVNEDMAKLLEQGLILGCSPEDRQSKIGIEVNPSFSLRRRTVSIRGIHKIEPPNSTLHYQP